MAGSCDDVKLLLSYDEDEIGSCMTTNYICIRKDMTIRQAMSELVKQAGENDNISTLYVVDENERFYGAIDLKDLIVARADDSLEKLIARSYPYVTDHEKISDSIDRIVDYAERSLPVLNESGKLLGIITSADVVELVDDQMGRRLRKAGRPDQRGRPERGRVPEREKAPALAGGAALPWDAGLLRGGCL